MKLMDCDYRLILTGIWPITGSVLWRILGTTGVDNDFCGHMWIIKESSDESDCH